MPTHAYRLVHTYAVILILTLVLSRVHTYIHTQSEVEFELSDDSPTIVALMQAIVTEYPDIEPLCPGLVLSVNLDWISIRDSSVVLKACTYGYTSLGARVLAYSPRVSHPLSCIVNVGL